MSFGSRRSADDVIRMTLGFGVRECDARDVDARGLGVGWESESVVVQGAFPFSPTRSTAQQVKAYGLPEVVGWDRAGHPAV